jgi:uncharacterized protein
MNIVLDSNVIIAAFAVRGLCHAVFEYCIFSHRIVISEHIIQEVNDNLERKLSLPVSVINEIEKYLREDCFLSDYELLPMPVCRDPKDDEILALAKQVTADYIVTGDNDLLVLKQFESTLIVTPREFWDKMRNF